MGSSHVGLVLPGTIMSDALNLQKSLLALQPSNLDLSICVHLSVPGCIAEPSFTLWPSL